MKKSFQATLLSKGPGGAWTYFVIPFDVHEAFGTQGRLAVKGWINEIPFRTSIMPEGDGTHFMMFNKELQAQTTAGAGDTVSVVLEADHDLLYIAAPAELEAAFRASPQASAFFDSLTYSQKKEYIDWITAAKQAATRQGRAAKAVNMLLAGKKRTR